MATDTPVERGAEPNPEPTDVDFGVTLDTPIPGNTFTDKLPPMSDVRRVDLAAGAQTRLPVYTDIVDGFLVYCLNDVVANQADQILVSNSPTTGDSTDDVITPGKSVTLLYQNNWITVANISANPHTVIVKAFRGWLPQYS